MAWNGARMASIAVRHGFQHDDSGAPAVLSLLTSSQPSLMTPDPPSHVPVLPVEVLDLLALASGEVWVDATTGLGGHTRLLAERVLPNGRVIALDQDPAMLERAWKSMPVGLPIVWMHANFDQLDAAVLAKTGGRQIDGVLADLGVCSAQLDDAARGLSFQTDGPLDMRLDPRISESAADLVNRLNERDLADVIYRYGEERHSRRIARRIVEQRKTESFKTTGQLAELVRRCVPRDHKSRIDPATRTFQALRIAVNDELGALERLLAELPKVLKPNGRAAIISFHSLEDRLVKRAFQDRTVWQPLTKKPVMAGDEEIRNNPRARSAKLRAARRLADGRAGKDGPG